MKRRRKKEKKKKKKKKRRITEGEVEWVGQDGRKCVHKRVMGVGRNGFIFNLHMYYSLRSFEYTYVSGLELIP
jgi:hypothetical protein